MAINYVKTTWQNGQAPALNATNLNKIEQGIKDSADKCDALDPVVTEHTSDITALETLTTPLSTLDSTSATAIRRTGLVSADTTPSTNGQINWTYA